MCIRDRGSRIIKPDNMAEFYISEQYLFMVLGIAFIVGNYCVRDFGSVGMQIIIRCGSIGKWFAGKVMWCFASALYMTALTDILIVIISVIHGYEPGLDVHMEVLRIYGYSENVTNVAAGEIVVMSLVLPLLSLFAIALVQMFLSMICSSVIALLLISTGMIITIFSGNVLLVFNGLMCMRNNIYTAGVVSLKRLLNQSNLKSWSSKMIKKSLEAYFFTLKNKIVFCKKQFQNMSVFCFVSTEIV